VLKTPCDSTLREVCDHVDPLALRPAFTKIIQTARNEGVLDELEDARPLEGGK
jgi:hypothetical protein